MKNNEIAKLSAIAIASALLLGSVLFIPAVGSANLVQQQQPLPYPPPSTPATGTTNSTTVNITGTFKVVSSKVLSTSVSDGIKTTESLATVARNDSTTPGIITSMITIDSVSHVNMTTGNGTSHGIGTFVGTIAGIGPGECTYSINSTLTAQGTPRASSHSQHWLTGCTGGLKGITETTTSIGSGVFSAVVTLDPSVPAHILAPYAQTTPYS